MKYETYENRPNRKITIHKNHCSRLRQHGGIQSYNQGKYREFQTFEDAYLYAKSTNFEIRNCSYCNP